MHSEITEFFSKTPYSIPHIIGFLLLVQSIVFFEVSLRSKDNYSKLLGLGLFLLGVAWGTTDYQNAGKLYVDWNWWWAQPLFAFGILFMSQGVIRYLPLSGFLKNNLSYINVFFPFSYLLLGTTLLILEVKVPRAFIIWMQLPPFFAICASTIFAEKNEPKKGHRLIGLLAILVPILSILFPLIGLKTAVLRFWTAIPLITLSSIVLAVSLLREREKIQDNLDKLRVAENKLLDINKDLERKVFERTALLHEIINDLESFNRNVSHDLKSPLGSISLTAELAERYLATGYSNLASNELLSIKEQVGYLQTVVNTMLNLAANVDKPSATFVVNFTALVKARIEKICFQFSRKYSQMKNPEFTVDEFGEINVNELLLNIVIDNLVENSIKYNLGQESLKIDIGCALLDGFYRIYVSDNGQGIDPDFKDDIFLPYKQGASNDAIDRPGGYGLGLSIVERAIRKLGGKVWFEDTPGGGATFIFTIRAS
jgi:signal transduction histidine kinase